MVFCELDKQLIADALININKDSVKTCSSDPFCLVPLHGYTYQSEVYESKQKVV